MKKLYPRPEMVMIEVPVNSLVCTSPSDGTAGQFEENVFEANSDYTEN